jgi:hypothetical protein
MKGEEEVENLAPLTEVIIQKGRCSHALEFADVLSQPLPLRFFIFLLQFFNCFQNLGADRMLKSNQTQVICAPAAFCTLHTLAHAGYET